MPAGYDASMPLPLVLDLHGYMEGAEVHRAHTGLEAFAGEESFVVLTPQGVGEIPYWNVLEQDGLVDDVKLISDLIDTTAAALCIDESRVYATGLSMGAFMTSLIGCRLSERVAAIAPVAGLRYPDDCAASRPMPVIAFHGTADEIVTYDGETGAGVDQLSFNDETLTAFDGLEMQAIPDALAGWAGAEGCADAPVEEAVSESVTLVRYDGCEGGSTVELYAAEGAGHSWPGSEFSAAIEGIVGPTTFEIDANELMGPSSLAHPLPS
ncbi:MAG: feruloyl esterase [Acidimicrobiia bacterium]|nr:feruloyl esterase [Acidimicrobiia bacterium]